MEEYRQTQAINPETCPGCASMSNKYPASCRSLNSCAWVTSIPTFLHKLISHCTLMDHCGNDDDHAAKAPALQLTKYGGWWLWRGFTAERNDIDYWAWVGEAKWKEGDDPVDMKSYDPIVAFPSLKPRLDIFGIPPRTRKQRGWYQVSNVLKGSSCAASSLPSRVDVAAVALATGADIPPELFDVILDCLDFWDKRTLGACARVCLYWASKCQPRLFERPQLNSREDILPLCQFERTPRSDRLPRLRSSCIASTTVSSPPWLHHMSVSHKTWTRNNSVDLDGPLPPQRTLRSVHFQLPRTSPQFSTNILQLRLTNVHFNHFDDLAHLMSDLRYLWQFRGEKLTWSLEPQPYRRGRSITHSSSFKAELKECSGSWAGLHLTYPRYEDHHRIKFPDDEHELVDTLVKDIFEVTVGSASGTVTCEAKYTGGEDDA